MVGGGGGGGGGGAGGGAAHRGGGSHTSISSSFCATLLYRTPVLVAMAARAAAQLSLSGTFDALISDDANSKTENWTPPPSEELERGSTLFLSPPKKLASSKLHEIIARNHRTYADEHLRPDLLGRVARAYACLGRGSSSSSSKVAAAVPAAGAAAAVS